MKTFSDAFAFPLYPLVKPSSDFVVFSSIMVDLLIL